MTTTPNPLYTVDTLADRIKAKYPDYAAIDNLQLVGKVVAKHPEYQAALHPAELGRITASSQPGAMQSAPGGPVQIAQQEPSFAQEFGGKLRDAAISAGQTVIPNAGTDPMQNIKNVGSNLNQQVNTAATTPWGQGGPIWGVLSMIGNALKSTAGGALEGGNKMLGGLGMDPNNPASFGPINSQAVAEGGGQMLGNAAQLGLMEKTPEAVGDPLGREAMQNLSNLGPAKANFLDRQVGTANAVQAQIKPALDALHADGKQLMGNVSSHIDSLKPEGVFDRSEVASKIKESMGVVKDESKIPPAIRRLTESEKTVPMIGGKSYNLKDPVDRQSYERMKAAGVFGSKDAGKMSFEELKQIHSDLGRQIASSNGPVEAGVKTAFKQVGEMLRNEADSNGMLDQWEEGRSKVKLFNDMAYRSPLKGTYAGANHGQIMQPLIDDKTGPGTIAMVERLEPYGIDVNGVKQSIGAYKWGSKWDKMSEPSRMTPILAAISPKMAALRTALPNAMRGSGMTGNMFPGSLEGIPAVKPTKIYPSKLAAAKELKGNPTPFGKGEE